PNTFAGGPSAVPDVLDRVVLDTGVYVAGLFRMRITPGRSLCPAIIQAARARTFQLVFIEPVLDELIRIAAREGWDLGWQGTLVDYLADAQADWPEPAAISNRKQQERDLTAVLRHEADAKIAVEARAQRPEYLIQDNGIHWNRLGG